MKKLFAFFLFALLVVTSCRKDSFPQPKNDPKGVRTNTVTINTTTTSSYNITYHLWYPYQTISVAQNTNATQSLGISLDSTNTHNIKLYLKEQYAGMFGGGMPTPEYNYNAEVLRSGTDTTVFLASLKSNNKCILINDSINDGLQWTTWLDLRDISGYSGMSGGISLGDWDWASGTGVNNGFVGIKIVTPSGNKYGWIKLTVPNCYRMTMEAQALNNNYGQFIQAGQTH